MVLASPALVESDSSVTSNQLLIIKMCSNAAHMANPKIIYMYIASTNERGCELIALQFMLSIYC